MKKVGIYERVSTNEQAQEGYSLGEQRERLTAYCKAKGWLIAEYYVDAGYSGGNLDRPGIQKLIAEIKNVEIVLVYKLDRLSRSQRDTLYLIEEVFLAHGVDFVSMNESFDTSTPFGRAMIGILSVFAQLEREQIRERTRMGLIARAKEGLYHGGANFPVGFDYVDGRLAINEYEALQVRKIYEWYLAGTSPEKIAERLRTEGYTNRYSSWSETAGRWHVLRILMSDVYLGTMRYAEVVVENAHPAIVSKEDFDKAQTIRLKRHEIYGDSAYQTKYLLVGMLHCAECGARYFVKHNYGGYKYYVCYSRARTNPRMITADHCENKNWRLDELEEVIEAQVKKLLISPKYYENLRKQHEKLKKAEEKKRPKTDADILREKVAKLDKQMGRLMDLYADEKLPAETISAKVDKIYREKLALVAQIEEIEPPEDEYDDTADDAETVAGILADFALIWDTSDTDERRKILTYLIKRIVLDGDSVKIEWNFLK